MALLIAGLCAANLVLGAVGPVAAQQYSCESQWGTPSQFGTYRPPCKGQDKLKNGRCWICPKGMMWVLRKQGWYCRTRCPKGMKWCPKRERCCDRC